MKKKEKKEYARVTKDASLLWTHPAMDGYKKRTTRRYGSMVCCFEWYE